MKARKDKTTQAKVDTYETLVHVFGALLKEVRELSKKKPDATLGKGKVKILNRVLSDAQACLKDEANAKYLDLLDDEQLPQFSDALLVMAQYEGALASFRARYHGYNGIEHTWFV